MVVEVFVAVVVAVVVWGRAGEVKWTVTAARRMPAELVARLFREDKKGDGGRASNTMLEN